MPRKDRSIPPKNANVRIEGEDQKKVEENILKALKKRECTKSDLYKKIGGYRVNGKELSRILDELKDRELVSSRYPQYPEKRGRNFYQMWGLYDHPKQVKNREWREESQRSWDRAVQRAVQSQRRRELKAEFDEFLADEAETFMAIADNLVYAAIRLGSPRPFWFSMSITSAP